MKRKLFSVILILSVLLGLVLSTQLGYRVQAAGPTCYVDDTATGPYDGLSWSSAFIDLQSALADLGCTQILVAAGTYAPTTAPDRYATFQLKNGVEIIGGYPDGGGDTPYPQANPTILSGNIIMGPGTAPPEDYDSYHVVTGSGVDASAVLDGFTIEDGNAIGAETFGLGGGIYINNGSPTLRNLVIQGNRALESGGGMYLFDSSPILINVDFFGNEALQSGSWGGGLSVYGVSHPSLNQVDFVGNSTWNGGGMYCEGAWNVQLNDATFQNNVAYQGGGLNLDNCGIGLANVTFDNNTSYGVGGGGMFTLNGAGLFSPTLTQVYFTGNYAASSGGGLYSSSGDIHLTDVTFSGNYAFADGGGLLIDSLGNATIQNTQFISNIADGDGGGLIVEGSATIRNSHFTSNTSGGTGGGLLINGNVTMVDSVVDLNYAASEGGGIALPEAGTTSTFTNLTVTRNQVDPSTGNGGGIYGYSNDATYTNLLLANNSAANGGGMANYRYSDPIIGNATIYGNHAEVAGSAIYDYLSSPKLANAIVWGNTETVPGPDIYELDDIYSHPTVVAAILEDGCPGGASCYGLISGDPQLIDPAAGDYRISAVSPAVDAGDLGELPVDAFDLDSDLDTTEYIPFDLSGNRRVVIGRVDLGAYEAQVWNTNWTEAVTLPLPEVLPDVGSTAVDRYLDRQGQSRWFKFSVQPSSKVIVTLTGLPANYDLALYKDIAQTYNELSSSQDLVQLSAEFAPDTFSPDTFSPDTFSPDTFSPDTFSPDTFSPDTFSPDTFSPDTFSPDTYSPDTFSPDTFSPDTFSPDTFSPDTYSPDTYSPDTFSPDTYSPDTYSPDTFSSAQTRSLIAVSAYESTSGEGILVNTWTQSGDFYVRVRGRNGVYDANAPFHLQVIMLTGQCRDVSPVLPASNTTPVDGGYQTLILTNPDKIEGSLDEKAILQTNLDELAAATAGRVVDVGLDARVSAASTQAEAYSDCVYAKNLEAYAVKEIVDGFRALNPLEYIVLVGNDQSIPFFRYSDNSLLASETGYRPPVRNNTTSQASLRMGYILTQDTYGASIELSNKAQTLPIPDLAVGRLVEIASDINQIVEAYLDTGNGVVNPTSALVTGYDFLEDSANAVRDELQAGLGANAVDTLIMSNQLSPQDPSAWTATDLLNSLQNSHHDLVFLAGHFSASTAVAADYKTSLTTSDVLASEIDFTNSLIYSAGCHSGYNIVNAHDVQNVTEEPDWAQAFTAMGATFIGGTGYQYGDTEFIEYSERLYLEFTRQLRYGSGPVAIGKALTQAKQAYLANTPLMRGIHEKSLLEATLFGLPMLQVSMPNQTPAPVDSTIVVSTTLFPSEPGATLGLEYADLHLTSTVTEKTVTLDQISSTGGETTQVTATYLEGPDGVVVNPAEPVLPLDMLNVTHPVSSDFVLRGIGWRGGTYTDLPDRLPFTGAATYDLRAPHPAFFSDVFYPVRPWNINYFDALSTSGGPTRLAWMPAQYLSSSPGSLTGTLRRFDGMDFRLYYSSNINTYTNTDSGSTNTPALSAPPDIAHIASSVEADGTVSFEITVIGDPAAGIQEAWIVYTGVSGSLYGAWRPLDLVQDLSDSRLWLGTLATGTTPVSDLRFAALAANGMGLVTTMTNEGAYYRAGVDPGAPSQGQLPVTLTLVDPATSGPYGGTATFTALASQNGSPLTGVPVAFHLGGQGRLAVTGGDGLATASFFLLAQPDVYTLSATFAGNESYAPANDSSSFEIVPGASSIVLAPALQEVMSGLSPEFVATVTSAGLPLALKPVALTAVNTDDGTVYYTRVAVTDYAGQARWQVPTQTPGSYTLTAWFGLPVSSELDLSTPYYTGASSTASLVVYPPDFSQIFSGFFPPVENQPVVNKVKAGSAVPVKFSLGGNFGLDIFADGYPTSTVTLCQAGNVDSVDETVNAGASSLSYDPLTDQYTYVWKTDKRWAGTCRTLVLKFIDNTTVDPALFQFTK